VELQIAVLACFVKERVDVYLLLAELGAGHYQLRKYLFCARTERVISKQSMMS